VNLGFTKIQIFIKGKYFMSNIRNNPPHSARYQPYALAGYPASTQESASLTRMVHGLRIQFTSGTSSDDQKLLTSMLLLGNEEAPYNEKLLMQPVILPSVQQAVSALSENYRRARGISETDTTVSVPLSYIQAFDALTPAEKHDIRCWTMIAENYEDENPQNIYHDGTSFSSIAEGKNYEINKALYKGETLSAENQQMVNNLDHALTQLPAAAGCFLRVAAYKSDEQNPYSNHRIQRGDVVTNYPAFMSVSDHTTYAENNLDFLDEDKNVQIFYYIEGTATPFIDGIASVAKEEQDWMMPRKSMFRVENYAFADAPSSDTYEGVTQLIAVKLVQIDPRREHIPSGPTSETYHAKNLFSGQNIEMPH
jgi:hypothetical protein